jgi:hypothetical protein
MSSISFTQAAAPAAPALAAPRAWIAFLRVAAPLLAILAACVLFRLPLATGNARLNTPLDPELLAQPWKLLLPFDFGEGRYRWTPTGYVPIGLLNLVMPAPYIFVLVLALLVVVSYVLSYLALRSRVFSGTLALCMGFGTQFNYYYVHNGGLLWPVFTVYLLLNLYFLHALATRPAQWRWPKIGFAVSLVAFALCWEMWLDYLVFLTAFSGFCWLVCRRDAELRERYLGRIRFVAATSVLVAIGYLAVRLPYSGEHFTTGHESDSIFTYSTPILSIDDLISNLFTYPYIALTNFCPSWFNGSNSLYHVGEERILAGQNGYHPEKAHLVGMHHLYFWHFYAGVVFLALVLYCVRSVRSAWKTPGYSTLMLVALLTLICTGFATHCIFKFRPYLSVPLLAYKCLISVIGVALLLSYGMMRLAERFAASRWRLVALACIWMALIAASIERFSYHSQQSQQVGLSMFPDPVWKAKDTVRSWLRHRS